jgi:aminopeptidase
MLSLSGNDPARGATMLVGTILRVERGDRFLVVADAESLSVAEALARAGERAGAQVTIGRLDLLRSVSTNHTGERPHKVLPDSVRRAAGVANASVFVASAPRGESGMRDQLLHIVTAARVRHAHMPGISARGFVAGMGANYAELEVTGRDLARRLEPAGIVEVESAAGSRLRCTFGTRTRWWEHLGTVTSGQWATLPAGALYAQPESVDGVFVADASLGEFFGAREGVLLDRAVRFFVEAGRVAKVEAPFAPALEREIRGMLAFAAGSDRISVVALGINGGITAPTGEATVDENLPGLHLVVGDPAGRIRVSATSARTSFLVCGAGARITADGELVIADGAIVPEP